MIASDLHLGHRNIFKYRTAFSSAEEHHEIIYDNLASNIDKKDTLILAGDVAFTAEWLAKIGEINCKKKVLILGNHDSERLHISQLVGVYDEIHSMLSHKGAWITHAPIHDSELRGKLNIHGHTHSAIVPDNRYINVCVEHTNWKPVELSTLVQQRRELIQSLTDVT